MAQLYQLIQGLLFEGDAFGLADLLQLLRLSWLRDWFESEFDASGGEWLDDPNPIVIKRFNQIY